MIEYSGIFRHIINNHGGNLEMNMIYLKAESVSENATVATSNTQPEGVKTQPEEVTGRNVVEVYPPQSISSVETIIYPPEATTTEKKIIGVYPPTAATSLCPPQVISSVETIVYPPGVYPPVAASTSAAASSSIVEQTIAPTSTGAPDIGE